MSTAINASGSPEAPGRLRLSGLLQSKDKPSREPGEGAAAPQKRRAAFYVDGFNLYHSLKDLGERHLLWLNLRALAEALINRREETVVKVVWCSAEYRRTPGHILRHRAYRQALHTVGVKFILGHFVVDELTCRAECKEVYYKDTEKAGDVNVGIYLIADGLQDVYDSCYLVSADSDQVGTVDMFQQRLRNKKLTVVAPPGRVHSKILLERDVSHKTIKRDTIERCLFDADVLFENGTHAVRRPAEYDPPANWRRPTKHPAAQDEEIVVEKKTTTETKVTTEVVVVRKRRKYVRPTE